MSVHQTKDGRWLTQYRIKGKKSPVKEYFGRGEEGKRAATARDYEIKAQKERGDNIDLPRDGLYLDDLAQLYLQDAKMRGVSEYWRKEFASLLNKTILPQLTHKPVDQLRYSDVLNMAKAWENASRATSNRYLGYLKAVFLFGINQELSSKNPLGKWKKAKEAKKDFRLTVKELERLIAHAPTHLAWALEVLWATGARPGPTELFNLKWTDHDPHGSTLHIRGTKTPTSDRIISLSQEDNARFIIMHGQAQSEYVIEYKGRQVKQMHSSLKTTAKKAGINHPVRLYDVRHLYASDMLRNGADLKAVSLLMGHADVHTTERMYYHLLEGEKERAVTRKSKIKRPTPPKVSKLTA